MEAAGVLVEHVGAFGRLRGLRTTGCAAARLARGLRSLCPRPLIRRHGAVAGRVVDLDARLDVGAPGGDRDRVPAVLERDRLQQHAAAHQLVRREGGGRPVEHVVARVPHVVGDGVLDGEHLLGVHPPGAGDEVPLVGVLGGELPADEVAAVVEVAALDQVVVARRLPTGRFHHADGAALLSLCRHGLGADDGRRRTAAAELVERGVFLVTGVGSRGRELILRERRPIRRLRGEPLGLGRALRRLSGGRARPGGAPGYVRE